MDALVAEVDHAIAYLSDGLSKSLQTPMQRDAPTSLIVEASVEGLN